MIGVLCFRACPARGRPNDAWEFFHNLPWVFRHTDNLEFHDDVIYVGY